MRFWQFTAEPETQCFAPPRSGWRQGSLFNEQDSPAQSKVYSQIPTDPPQPQRFSAAQCSGKRCVQPCQFMFHSSSAMQHAALGLQVPLSSTRSRETKPSDMRSMRMSATLLSSATLACQTQRSADRAQAHSVPVLHPCATSKGGRCGFCRVCCRSRHYLQPAIRGHQAQLQSFVQHRPQCCT